MAQIVRSCIQSMLKLMNSGLGMVGIAMAVYSLWMLRVWLRDELSAEIPIPWFIYTILGLGVTLCLITCSGHIAAETANGCCLYLYMFFVFLLFVVEAAVTADIFLNHDWEEDFPEDPSGNFDKLKDFIRENFDICKWIGLAVVALQVNSLLFLEHFIHICMKPKSAQLRKGKKKSISITLDPSSPYIFEVIELWRLPGVKFGAGYGSQSIRFTS